jgi:predicted ATPase
MELIEREEALDRLAEAERAAQAGEGRLVLIAGEAGIGKTSVLDRFLRVRAAAAPAAWGWCDPLSTPRPLAPFRDLLEALAGRTLPPEDQGAVPEFLSLLFDRVRTAGRPVVMALEDAHWADEASLELLRLIGRRIHTVPALLVVTYRDDEIGAAHPLRRALGELATALAVSKVRLQPLSVDGVRHLAAGSPVDAVALHHWTGGNPFFVAEVLENRNAGGIPGVIGDLVLERMARLAPPARALLEAAAVLGRAQYAILRCLSPAAAEEVHACIAVGPLRGMAAEAAFRHELVRQVVLESLSPPRASELHAEILRALEAMGEQDPARLAHHAEGAGDGASVLRHAPAAARHAASVGSHREAAAQLARALKVAGDASPKVRAALLAEHARECAALDRLDDAVRDFTEAARIWRAMERPREEADCRAAAAFPLVRAGRNAEADESCRCAIELLEATGPSRALAQALRAQAHLRMLDWDKAQALHFGRRAIGIAKALGDRAILAAAQMTVGSALLVADDAKGRSHLDSAIALAREDGCDELVAHAYLNIGTSYGEQYHLPDAERFLRDGIAFAAERDLDQHLHYMQAWLALALVYRGRLDEAAGTAQHLQAEHAVAPVSRIMALVAARRAPARLSTKRWSSRFRPAPFSASRRPGSRGWRRPGSAGTPFGRRRRRRRSATSPGRTGISGMPARSPTGGAATAWPASCRTGSPGPTPCRSAAGGAMPRRRGTRSAAPTRRPAPSPKATRRRSGRRSLGSMRWGRGRPRRPCARRCAGRASGICRAARGPPPADIRSG